ncbi:hypothetical protein E3E14_00255 [Streptomyces sp. ICN441]|uniref:hypothetical protein n=1 Tax=Streptomyces sp. ICN441 TaxID=2558286 RepID=UPI00035CDF23|nr:hypothetical protein [Streptomyces sp. ICN441]TFE58598.1 hypothetical protein E3E14_00255 [Streptomyces sp. ICN441]
MRKLARVFATAALAVTAGVIPMTGTAMAAAPAHSAVGAYQFHGVDRCADLGRRYVALHTWDRHRARWDRDCRHRWERRLVHRSHWYDAYGKYRSHAGYAGDCGHRY